MPIKRNITKAVFTVRLRYDRESFVTDVIVRWKLQVLENNKRKAGCHRRTTTLTLNLTRVVVLPLNIKLKFFLLSPLDNVIDEDLRRRFSEPAIVKRLI